MAISHTDRQPRQLIFFARPRKNSAPPAPPGHPGLYHVAILYPDRASLGAALARVLAAGVPLQGAADHGVSEAVYFADPDGHAWEVAYNPFLKIDAKGNIKLPK